MKKNYFLLTFFLMGVMGMQVSATNILVDFSTLDDATNSNTQQGWLVSGIMNEINMAKYLVLEVEGEGDKKDGFDGIQFIFQGNDGDHATIEVGWTQRNLNGDWVSFPCADGKTVSIVIDINNALGDKYDDFLQCTGWARILIGYYGSKPTAFESIGITNTYLIDDFEKPAGAVDLASDYGFIFEGSVAGSVIPKEKENLPMANNGDLGSGDAAKSSYEAATKTITFNEGWTNRGWWFGSKDCSDYVQVVIEIEETDAQVELIVEYVNGAPASKITVEPGETRIVVDLDPASKDAIKQVYIQRSTAGTVVLVEAYLSTKSVTSISDVANSSFIAYYAGNTLFLNGFGDVQIYNINGSTLLTKQNVSSVDLSALGKGVYIAKTIVNGQAQVVKILK